MIFKTEAKKIARYTLTVPCAACNTPNSVQMDIYQRYLNVLVPFVPYGRTATIQCSHCHITERQEFFPPQYNAEFLRLKKIKKTPLWTFTGSAAIVVFLIGGTIAQKLDDVYDAKLILEPQKGDLYEVKLRANEYTVYKVDRAEGNMTYLFENEYVTDKAYPIDNLKDKPYTKESYPVSTHSLKVMHEKGQIMSVERPLFED